MINKWYNEKILNIFDLIDNSVFVIIWKLAIKQHKFRWDLSRPMLDVTIALLINSYDIVLMYKLILI